jgi:hypothetical protein
VKVAGGEGVIDKLWHTYGIIERFTPSVLSEMRAARQQKGELSFGLMNRLHVPIALFAMGLLPVLLLTRGRWPQLEQLRLLAAVVAVAILANAFICGALANPHDRYGARLIWLAPFTIMLAPLCIWGARAGRLQRRLSLRLLASREGRRRADYT